MEDDWLSLPPEAPLPSDCCGSGCNPCVQDIYQEELARWKRIKEMSGEERKVFFEQERRKVDNGDDKMPSAINPGRYTSFEVDSVRRAAGNANVYRFKLPAGHKLGLCLGQHIVARVWNDKGEAITRQYTPVSPLDQVDWFEVVIKLYPNGLMSQEIERWCVGSQVEWKGPYGGIEYHHNQYRRLLMLACGTGVAPMIQIIRHILSNEDEETRLHLVYACRTQHDILMKDYILNECSSHWNFRATYHLSQCTADALKANSGQVRYTDEVVFSRLTEELVTQYLESVTVDDCFMVLVCGTRSFDKDMIKYATKNRVDSSRYHKF